MAFNFPANPAVDDSYEYGGQSYTWNGYAWMLTDGGIAPPEDYVKVTGDVMTGPLVLTGSPVQANEAVNKAYVDNMLVTAGSGNVVGPNTAIDNEIVLFNGVTGKQIKGSGTPISNFAKLDALSYNGMQINGSFDINQESAGLQRSTSGYVCDGWYLFTSGAMVPVSASTPFTLNEVPGFKNLIYVTINTALGSLGPTDQVILFQRIEGNRVSRLGWGTLKAAPLTVGFWSGNQTPGIYSVVVSNGGDRYYATTYNHLVAGVYQYNTITIPGDTTGTWHTDTSIGLVVTFCLAAGASLVAPAANVWAAGNMSAAPGQINGAGSTSDALRITGVVVLPGISAPTAAQSPLIMRPADQEIEVCRRQFTWNGGFNDANFLCQGVSWALGCWPYPVSLRVSPILTIYNGLVPNQVALFNGGIVDGVSPFASGMDIFSVINHPANAFPGPGNFIQFNIKADARL